MFVAPTFISLGSHEWMISQGDVERITSIGAVVLDNNWTRHGDVVTGRLMSAIVTNYQRFREKGGGRYPYRPRHAHPVHIDTESAWLDIFENQDGYKVLLCHHPEYWSLREPWLSEKRIDFVLSGYAHGSQVRFFGRGLYTPGQGWFPKYTGGVYDGKRIISRGLANTAGVPRVFNQLEIVYLEVGKR